MRIMITPLIAAGRFALASGSVNLATADISTCERTGHSRASILTEVPMMYQSRKAKMTARGVTIQQQQEENQRREQLCVS